MQQNEDKPRHEVVGIPAGASGKSGLSWSTPTQQSEFKQPSLISNSPQKSLPPAAQKSTPVATYAAMIIGGIVVGILIAWGWSALRAHSGSVTTTTSSSKTTSQNTSTSSRVEVAGGGTNMAQSDELTVPSPQQAGQSIVITQANIGEPTWVVVYEDRDGAPGNVLGAQLFFTSGPGIVTLLRGTVAGQTYWVGTSVDDGDHKYTKTTDKPALNNDGTLQVVSFTAN